MSRKQRRSRSSPGPSSTRSRPVDPTDPGPKSPDRPPDAANSGGEPQGWLPAVVTTLLTLHLFAIFLSFSGVVEVSTIHSRLLQVVQPYLQLFAFGAEDRPVYLAHGESDENPHRLQVTDEVVTSDSGLDGYRWRTIEPPGYAGLVGNDRYHRWLSTAAMLAGDQQSSLAAELMLSIANQQPEARALRIVRHPSDLEPEAVEPETVYLAAVIREPDGPRLVQIDQRRLSSPASPDREVSDE